MGNGKWEMGNGKFEDQGVNPRHAQVHCSHRLQAPLIVYMDTSRHDVLIFDGPVSMLSLDPRVTLSLSSVR